MTSRHDMQRITACWKKRERESYVLQSILSFCDVYSVDPELKVPCISVKCRKEKKKNRITANITRLVIFLPNFQLIIWLQHYPYFTSMFPVKAKKVLHRARKKNLTAEQYDLALRHKNYLHKNCTWNQDHGRSTVHLFRKRNHVRLRKFGYFLVYMGNSALQTEQLKYDDLAIFFVVVLLFSRSRCESVNAASSTAPQTSSDRIQFTWLKSLHTIESAQLKDGINKIWERERAKDK